MKIVDSKHCINCKYKFVKPDKEPCRSCIDIMSGERHNWGASVDEIKTKGNNSDTKLIRCAVCKYKYKYMDEEPCNSCVNMGRGDKCKGEEVNCSECKYASVNINEEPCKNCSKNSRNSQIVSNLYFEPITAHCYDCKHISKGIDESPCNECCEVYRGEYCKWEGIYCEDCKYVEVDMDAEPCKNCSNNAWNCNKDKLTLNLHFEPKETESKQEVYNGVIPSCSTCKHFETKSNNEPCSHCMAICNGHTSYWEERDSTKEPQVEKTVEQRLQEEHFDEHYHNKVQPLEIMQEIMTPEEFRGFLFGNIIKYSCRCGRKDEPQKEFAKLRRYREWYDKAVLGEHIDPRV